MSDPWQHSFTPDPQTPTACVICGLHAQWHPEHQPRESDRHLSLPQQAALESVRKREAGDE
jgi:hypothetical protein